jgi:serine protease Do
MGNSGGALVDTEGRLVGVNSAIFSRSGGNQGIGFAVPANQARAVMESLRKNGRVVRSYIGVLVQPLTRKLAEAFGIKEESGALVSEVFEDSPARKAGVENGDVIIEVDGKPVTDSRQLRLVISSMKPGTIAKVGVVRGGKPRQIDIKLAEMPRQQMMASGRGAQNGDDVSNALDGVTVGEITPDARQRFKIPPEMQGALIIEIKPDSEGAEAGLKVGDVIHEINRQPVTTADEAVEISRKIDKGKAVLLRISTKGDSRYIVVQDKEE